MRSTLALLLLLLVTPTLAEVKVYPPADQAIGAVTSETVGRWIVFRAAPFGVVKSETITLGGEPGCLWTGEAGTYTAVLVPTDTSIGIETGTVVLGGDKPGPGPGPDPDPDVKVDGVVLIVEQSTTTAYLNVAIGDVREWVFDQNHFYRLYDPDQPAAQPYLDAANKAGLPAIVMLSGDKVVGAKTFPSPGRTPDTAVAAGKAAIKIVKEAGG